LFLYGNLWKLKRFSGSFEQGGAKHHGIFIHKKRNRQEKLESVLLSQLHFKLPAKFKYNDMTSRLAVWPLRTCFKMAAVDFFGD